MDILWWHWLVLGLLLMLAEMASAGGFYILFFGVGAVVVGVLAGAGLAGPLWTQVLLFAGVSIGTLVMFRKRLLQRTQLDPQAPPVDSLVGEVAIVSRDLGPDEVGKVELRGASWSARNISTAPLAAGARCRVVGVDGLLLYVGPEGTR